MNPNFILCNNNIKISSSSYNTLHEIIKSENIDISDTKYYIYQIDNDNENILSLCAKYNASIILDDIKNPPKLKIDYCSFSNLNFFGNYHLLPLYFSINPKVRYDILKKEVDLSSFKILFNNMKKNIYCIKLKNIIKLYDDIVSTPYVKFIKNLSIVELMGLLYYIITKSNNEINKSIKSGKCIELIEYVINDINLIKNAYLFKNIFV